MSDEPEYYYVECPQCSGESAFLGNLGKRRQYRCRWCGWVFSEPIIEEETRISDNYPVTDDWGLIGMVEDKE